MKTPPPLRGVDEGAGTTTATILGEAFIPLGLYCPVPCVLFLWQYPILILAMVCYNAVLPHTHILQVFLLGTHILQVFLLDTHILQVFLLDTHILQVFLLDTHILQVFLLDTHILQVFLLDTHILQVFLLDTHILQVFLLVECLLTPCVVFCQTALYRPALASCSHLLTPAHCCM